MIQVRALNGRGREREDDCLDCSVMIKLTASNGAGEEETILLMAY